MSVTIKFTIDEAEYRALARIANAREITLPVLYRAMGRNLAAAVADGRAPLGNPKPRSDRPSEQPTGTPGRLLDEWTVSQISVLYVEQQLSAHRIGKNLGISDATVYRYLDLAGIPRRPAAPRRATISDELAAQLRALHEDRATLQTMRATTGLSESIVRRALTELGLPPQPRGRRTRLEAAA